MMLPPFLIERYQQVLCAFQMRFPGRPAPPCPDGLADPNQLVMIIDEMLGAMQDRAPTRLTYGKGWVAENLKTPEEKAADGARSS